VEILSSSPPLTASKSRVGITGRLWVVFVFLGILWFVLCRHLSSEWSLNEQYSYGWFVPFFAAYLFWLRWEDRPAESAEENVQRPTSNAQRPTKGRRIAPAAGIVALLVLVPVRLFEVANPDWRPLGWIHSFAVIGITFAVIYLVGGWSWTKHFSFPVLFFLVAVPWITPVEAPIVQALMRVIAALATETVSLLGIPAQVEGNLIRIANGVVGVNEACSGVRSLQTSLMIGLLFGELKRLPWISRLLLVAGAVAIALIANFFRAVFLVWIASTREIAAVDRWHDFVGYAIVALVFLGSLALAALLARRARKQKSDVRDQRLENGKLISDFRPLTSGCLLALVFVVATEIGVEAWYRVHERKLVLEPAWTVDPPKTAKGFRELKIEERVRSTLRFDTGRQVVWTSSDAGESASPTTNYLYFFRWNPGSSSVLRARSHRPDICLPAAGWTQLSDAGTKTYVARDGVTLPTRHITFKQDNGNAIVHTFFCLQEDETHADEESILKNATGIQPSWSRKARIRVVRNGVRNLGQQVLEVAFINPEPVADATAEERFAALVRDVVVAEKK
jgi:exosortase